MTYKPVTFDDGDLKVIGSGALDPTVLPSTVVTTDGAHAFVSPQPGVTPTLDAHLTTRGAVKAQIAALPWQGTVKSATTSAQPGSPTTGDRYVLPVGATGAAWAGNDKAIAEWTGSAWTFYTPAVGWITYVVDLDRTYRYGGTTWADTSTIADHESLTGLQGGTTGQHQHLTTAEHTLLTGSQAARKYLGTGAAPGVPTMRTIDGGDVGTGQIAAARGGLAVDASAAAGYAKWTAGTPAFSATIPWGDLSSVPLTFAPAVHATSHGSGGTDPVALDGSQITSGLVGRAQGGTGANGSSVTAGKFLASPTLSTGIVTFRLLVPDDVSGATAAYQVLQRNAANTANVWQVIDTSSLGAVPVAREIQTPAYLSGGGTLNADLSLDWIGVDVWSNGTTVARRPILNFIGAVVTEDTGTGKVDVEFTATGTSMDPIVAALVFGGG